MLINNKDDALKIVDTQIRQKWLETNTLELGQAEIIQEIDFTGHKAWQYHIEGLPMSRDARKRWLVDTGETVDTTINEDENTLDKAYAKLYRYMTFRKKAAQKLGIDEDNLSGSDIKGLGMRFFEAIRGGRSIIIGDDGGVLIANSSVSIDEHIQAYRDGKRN